MAGTIQLQRQVASAAQNASAVQLTATILGGKWKAVLLYHLKDGELHFNQLRRHMPGITQRMLTLQLRELERMGIVERRTYPGARLRVGYRLTGQGEKLLPLLRLMRQWGEGYSGPAAQDARED